MNDEQADQLTRYLGPLEMRIMDDVWQHGPSTVNDVLARLNGASRKTLVYNTVMSTLTRLFDKGFLERHRDGRAYVYRGDGPEVFLRGQAARATRDLVEDLGEVGVAGIVDGLQADADTQRLMQQLLNDEHSSGGRAARCGSPTSHTAPAARSEAASGPVTTRNTRARSCAEAVQACADGRRLSSTLTSTRRIYDDYTQVKNIEGACSLFRSLWWPHWPPDSLPQLLSRQTLGMASLRATKPRFACTIML